MPVKLYCNMYHIDLGESQCASTVTRDQSKPVFWVELNELQRMIYEREECAITHRSKKFFHGFLNPMLLTEPLGKSDPIHYHAQQIKYYTIAIGIAAKAKLPCAALFSNRGEAHFELKNYKDSLEDQEKAISSDPSYVKSYSRKARALQKEGRLTDAL